MKLDFQPRARLSPWTDLLITGSAVIVAFAVGAGVMALAGLPPAAALAAIFRAGFFGGFYSLSDTLVKATPLILCGVGCALAFRAGLWNVGAEGQLFLGAWAAAGIASFWTPAEMTPWLKIPLMMLCGTLAGAAWGAIPGFLKARYRVSEILTSLMLVYVAVQWNTYWIYSPWSDRGFQMTPVFPQTAWLPRLADYADTWPSLCGITIHAGWIIALVAAVLLGILMQKSRWGFIWRSMGDNPDAAAAAGMKVKSHIFYVMALSGAASGLAGAIEVAGVVHRLQERFSPGFGFTAITVAFLARLNPWAAIVVAIALGGILVGSKEVGSQGVAALLQGSLLLVVILFEWFRKYEVRIKSGGETGGGES